MQTLKTSGVITLVTLALTGCAMFKTSQPATLRIHEQVNTALPSEHTLVVDIPKANLRIAVATFPTLTEKDLLSAELYDTAGGKAILLRFDIHGTMLLDECTTRSRDQYLVTFINDHPVSAWFITQRIFNGQFLVEGDFTDEEAKQVVDELNKQVKKNSR
jgi:hypothetical protein